LPSDPSAASTRIAAALTNILSSPSRRRNIPSMEYSQAFRKLQHRFTLRQALLN
jgi:hypothetical protein